MNNCSINPIFHCGQDIEFSVHFFLHFPFFIDEIHTRLSTVRSLDSKLFGSSNYDLTQTLLLQQP